MSHSINVGTGPKRRSAAAWRSPDGLGNSGAVIVDQDIDVFGGVMAGKMDLANRLDGECVQIGDRIKLKIECTDIDVIDVAEYVAAGSTGDFGHEFRLRNVRISVAEVGGRILD